MEATCLTSMTDHNGKKTATRQPQKRQATP